MRTVLDRLYRTKQLLVGSLLVGTGIGLLTLGNELSRSPWLWIRLLPVSEAGGILLGAGLLSIWLDHFFRREQDEIDEERLRRLLHDQAPAMRDAVLEAFAANHADLVRVATPAMLDQLIANSLALRLGDDQFAHEVYADIRDQAVSASERWLNASLSIELTPAEDVPGNQHFAVTVRWEYETIPHHAQRRFVCVSDRDDYAELAAERGETSAWYIKPVGGFDASDSRAFELLQFRVNGESRNIRRSPRKRGQLYSASIGAELVDAGRPVTVAYTYRTITRRSGHLLFFDIEQPTRDLKVDFDYSACDIATVSTLDLVPTVRPIRLERSPDGVEGRSVRVDIDGWVFPRSGVAFVWTLDGEVGRQTRRALRTAPERRHRHAP